MMPIGGEAPKTLAIIWSLTTVTLVFVILRLYTRVKVLKMYRIDDHFFNAAFVVYCILITIASLHGFGRSLAEIPDIQEMTTATNLSTAAHSVAFVTMWVAKTSMVLLLLRLVRTTRQKLFVVVPSVMMALFVTGLVLLIWLGCDPVATCSNLAVPGTMFPVMYWYPYVVFAAVVVADFWYAAIPWFLLWKIKMPHREKVLVQMSLSLGVLAGICGIMRAVAQGSMYSPEFLRDTWDLVVWNSAELTVTMAGIGVAVCRPLYKDRLIAASKRINFLTKRRRRLVVTTSRSTSGGGGSDSSSKTMCLYTIGGSPRRRRFSENKLVESILTNTTSTTSTTSTTTSNTTMYPQPQPSPAYHFLDIAPDEQEYSAIPPPLSRSNSNYHGQSRTGSAAGSISLMAMGSVGSVSSISSLPPTQGHSRNTSGGIVVRTSVDMQRLSWLLSELEKERLSWASGTRTPDSERSTWGSFSDIDA